MLEKSSGKSKKSVFLYHYLYLIRALDQKTFLVTGLFQHGPEGGGVSGIIGGGAAVGEMGKWC